MEFDLERASSYRVEVSGWDASENFFVEKTVLDWRGEGKKRIALKSKLREGSVVFVRLLQPLANKNNFPIAYQAAEVGARDNSGRVPVSLERLRPREAGANGIGLAGDHAIQVA
ncbi:MAG TPA: hypothetical protein VEG64_12400 [Candidatus Sulfotelmatobacter sp.]|nr:hypothetical protein [Candidatus Sulfotelmatobacter sp.]